MTIVAEKMPLVDFRLRGKALLLAVKAAILEEPKRLRMGDWLDTRDPNDKEYAPACGTVGCIAGWCTALTVPLESLNDYMMGGSDVQAHAEERLFGDDPDSGSKTAELFYTDNWPDDLERRYNAAYDEDDTYKIRAEVTAEAIDRFIARHFPDAA